MTSTSLPEYAHPPLVSATLGVVNAKPQRQDEIIREKFQQELGPEWHGAWTPTDAAATAVIDAGMADGWRLANVLGDRRVRINERRFEFTWLGAEDGRYPRYENLRDGFVAAWDLWSKLQSKASPRTWIVSYLNRMPQGTVWQTAADWKYLQWLGPATGSAVQPVPEEFAARWKFPLTETEGSLVVELDLQPFDVNAETPCLWLRLTAEGPLPPNDPARLLDGMDVGRSAIVQTFSDLMSPSANAYWGLRRR